MSGTRARIVVPWQAVSVGGPREIVVVYVTAPETAARDLARQLVERRLAACVNIVAQVRSIYAYDGRVHEDLESLLIIKVARAGFEALRAAVIELHPYELPEVIALDVPLAHEPYAAWVVEGSSGLAGAAVAPRSASGSAPGGGTPA
jgi:periplasmic divalent cation tolerance protein